MNPQQSRLHKASLPFCKYQVTWLVLLLCDTDWVAFIASTVFTRLNHSSLLLRSIYRLKVLSETVNHLQQLQNARIQVAYQKLLDSSSIENFVHMGLGMEVDLNFLKKMSAEYAEAKNVAVKEASSILDVQNIKHILEDKELIGDVVEKIADDWHVQKQTGLGEDEVYGKELEQLLLQQCPDDQECNQD